MMNPLPPQPDLDWLAFQYVNHNLPPPEREAFEQRLLESQAAREAVAQAVELTLAVEFVCRTDAGVLLPSGEPAPSAPGEGARPAAAPTRHPPAAPARRCFVPRVAWASAAAAVIFVLGWQAAFWFLDRGHDRAVQIGQSRTGPIDQGGASGLGREVALAWSQTRRLYSLAETDAEGIAGTYPGDETPMLEDAPLSLNGDEPEESPAWMLAAVAGLHGASESAGAEEPPHSSSDPASAGSSGNAREG